jgi:hypothetical protein
VTCGEWGGGGRAQLYRHQVSIDGLTEYVWYTNLVHKIFSYDYLMMTKPCHLIHIYNSISTMVPTLMHTHVQI